MTKKATGNRQFPDLAKHVPPGSPDLNPIEQAVSKFKHRMRGAGARTRDTLWRTVGTILDRPPPEECASHFENARYASAQNGTALQHVAREIRRARQFPDILFDEASVDHHRLPGAVGGNKTQLLENPLHDRV